MEIEQLQYQLPLASINAVGKEPQNRNTAEGMTTYRDESKQVDEKHNLTFEDVSHVESLLNTSKKENIEFKVNSDRGYFYIEVLGPNKDVIATIPHEKVKKLVDGMKKGNDLEVGSIVDTQE